MIRTETVVLLTKLVRHFCFTWFVVFAMSSVAACSGGPSATNPTVDAATQALPPISNHAIGSSVIRKAPLTLPAGCSNQYPGYIYCNVAVGTSLALPTPITIATGFNPCGPTATLSTVLYAGTSDPDITISISPMSESVSCGQTITPTVTFTVSSAATPNRDIQAHAYANYQVCDEGCTGDSSNSDDLVITVVSNSCNTARFAKLPTHAKYAAPACTAPSPSPSPCPVSTPGPVVTKPDPLLDSNGLGVLRPDNDPFQRPDDGHDPQFFITAGRSSNMLTALTNLANFQIGNVWDEQRFAGKFYPQFRDYATIAIGLYGAASGTSSATLLGIQNGYAGMASEYAAGTVFDTTYTNLPARNVVNTLLGYQLYQGMNGKSCY